MVVAALLHDIGDDLTPLAHGELAAAVLRPYVSEKTSCVVKHHGLFQLCYYAHHVDGERNTRDRFARHPYYQATVDFCANYDTLRLEHFDPMLRRVLNKVRFTNEDRKARYGT